MAERDRVWKPDFPADLPGIWQFRRGLPVFGALILCVCLLSLGVLVLVPGRVLESLERAGGFGNLLQGLVVLTSVLGMFHKPWLAVGVLFLAFLAALFGLGKDWLAPQVLVLAPILALYLGRRRPPRPRWGKSQWTLVQERFLHSSLAQVGLAGVVLLYLATFLAPYLAPFDPLAQPDPSGLKLAAPLTHGYLLGADQFSRDVLSRILHGAWISMTIGLFAVLLSASLGMFFGLVAGWFGGWIDGLISRLLIDNLLSIPRLPLLLVFMALFKDAFPPQYRIYVIILILGATGWMGTARLVRGEVLTVRERDFVQAGRALGLSQGTLLFKHVAPNCLAPVLVSATLGIGGTILVEAALSFLSLGVPPPTPSWGAMVNDGRQFLTKAWWISTFPGLVIVVAVTCFNLLGDGLRDALDPKLIGRERRSAPDDEDETEGESSETLEARTAS